MNILIDIGHPGHVHLLKRLYFDLLNNNHKVFVTIKDIPVIKELLDKFSIQYINLGKKKDSLLNKALYQLSYNYKVWRLIKKFNIDVGIGTSVSLSHVSRFSQMQSVLLDDDDDEVQPYFVKYVHPYCDFLISPDVLKGKRKREDTVYYPGLHELAYLHPNHFKPDKKVLSEVGLSEGDDFFLLRFNAFKAHHDSGVKGFSLEQKKQLVKLLKAFGKILITTERDIEPEFKQYQLKNSPEKIHSLLAYAKMFIGDSQTMASEAAVLGTPSLRCNSLVGRISNLLEEEKKYGLTFGFTPDNFDNLISKVKELLQVSDLKSIWLERRRKLLEDMIDSSKFYLWLVENVDIISKTSFNREFFEQFSGMTKNSDGEKERKGEGEKERGRERERERKSERVRERR